MRILIDPYQPQQPAPALLVLLPGAYGLPEDFIGYGFVSALREQQLPMDIAMLELPFNQIADDSLLDEMHTQLVEPALAAGQVVWLAGISIGGYLAMAYAEHYANQITGMFLIAPYPGNRMTTNEIMAAGGLARWSPEEGVAIDTERRIWRWLKESTALNMPIYMGVGQDDRFSAGHHIMAKALPPAHVDSITGGHEWAVWRQLWQNFLDRQCMLESLSEFSQLHGN
ncbi:MAG: alpha/beta hydrolase [Methylophilaceae bacterium]|nr:alpha/beta hydrolase [Methyloradius sp.]